MFEIGLATSFGYIVPFFIGASFFLNRKNKSLFRVSLQRINLKMCGEIMRLGTPSGVAKLSSALGGMLINNMLTAANTRYLVAAYGVFSQITVFVRSAWFAATDTLQSFVGIFIGEEDRNSLKEVQKISLTYALIHSTMVAAIIFVFAVPLAKIFLKSDDPEALKITVECLRVSSLSISFYAIIYNFNNYLLALRRLNVTSIYSFVTECGIIVPMMFFMLRLIGYHGAWVSKIMSMLVLCIIAAVYVYINGKGKTYRDKMLLLPESFGIPLEDEITVAASTTEEILDLSRLAIAFASEHGSDMSRAKTFGLITEELAGVLTEHGFSDGKTHNINTRLVSKGDELIIRMRDDCKPFNLTEYYQIVHKNRENNAGIAIVMKMSKSVTYTNALGTNNLIVRI